MVTRGKVEGQNQMQQILDKLNRLEASVANKNDIKNLRDHIDGTVTSLKETVAMVDTKVEDIIDSAHRITNLRFDGVPSLKSENVHHIVGKLFSLAGVTIIPEHSCYRLKNGPIIIQFATEFHKENFFRQYLKCSKIITLDKFTGEIAQSSTRCYVSHDLCKTQYNISKLATKLKKDGKIHSTLINRGYVMVKHQSGSSFTRIDSEEMLNHLINADEKRGSIEGIITSRSLKVIKGKPKIID